MKRTIHLLCLVFILYSITGESFSQDKLYLNDLTPIKLLQTEFRTGPRGYNISAGGLSREQATDAAMAIKRNYIGIELFETLLGGEYWVDFGNNGKLDRFHLTYERLSKTGETGLAVELLLGRKARIDSVYGYFTGSTWEGNWFLTNGLKASYAPFNSFIKAGFSYYPFNYSLNHVSKVRFLSGISLLAGDINKRDYFNFFDDYKSVFVVFLVSNLDMRVYLSRYFQIKAGIDISLLPFLVFFAPEAGFSFGF